MDINGFFILLDVIGVAELLASLYFCYQVIRDMKQDLEYSVTRIFLSQRSVRGMKVMILSLITYAVINVVIVFFLSGIIFDTLIRINVILLFAGLLYYFWQISSITRKRSAP